VKTLFFAVLDSLSYITSSPLPIFISIEVSDRQLKKIEPCTIPKIQLKKTKGKLTVHVTKFEEIKKQ
jgi:hypothetical protein